MPRSWPGVRALLFPGQLIPGYEHCTGHSWPALWAPITYDLTTGAIGPFELLEWVLLAAVLLALIATWCFFPVGQLTAPSGAIPRWEVPPRGRASELLAGQPIWQWTSSAVQGPGAPGTIRARESTGR